MLAARASAVLALAAGGWTLVGIAFGQQPAGHVVPVVATVEALLQPPGNRAPSQVLWMPSHVAGHLADRLQALHEPSAVAEASPTAGGSADTVQLESAARTPPVAVLMSASRPIAAQQPAAESPAVRPLAVISTSEPKPVAAPPSRVSIPVPEPAAAPRRISLPAQQPVFGGNNPLRGNR